VPSFFCEIVSDKSNFTPVVIKHENQFNQVVASVGASVHMVFCLLCQSANV
jgi:hypothetical protein